MLRSHVMMVLGFPTTVYEITRIQMKAYRTNIIQSLRPIYMYTEM